MVVDIENPFRYGNEL